MCGFPVRAQFLMLGSCRRCWRWSTCATASAPLTARPLNGDGQFLGVAILEWRRRRRDRVVQTGDQVARSRVSKVISTATPSAGGFSIVSSPSCLARNGLR